jgi:uncharacterized protein
LNSSIQGEIRLELKKRSDTEAIKVFRDNLYNLLLAPPAGPISVLGIDPRLRTGCKVAVVDETGKLLAHDVLYPAHVEARQRRGRAEARGACCASTTCAPSPSATARPRARPTRLCATFCAKKGIGTHLLRHGERVGRQRLLGLRRGPAGVSRSRPHRARRHLHRAPLQDPLSELVKVDPKSIGVGQYQHDVDQRQLQESLETVIESCVNKVGVDLNTSSWTLLRFVAGITERTALNIVSHRDEKGSFRSRMQVLEVAGHRPQDLRAGGRLPAHSQRRQPAGHDRGPSGVVPVVEQIAGLLNASVEQIIQRPELLEQGGRSRLSAGAFTVNDILAELRKPGRDPRDTFVAPSFREEVRELADVQAGMVLEGVVTNVTKFGAFVDIGVHQDGLVHISELSNRYIKEPSEAVKTGQIVKVKVLSVDAKPNASRFPSSSSPPAARPPARPAKSAPKLEPTMDEKLAALSTKWKVR